MCLAPVLTAISFDADIGEYSGCFTYDVMDMRSCVDQLMTDNKLLTNGSTIFKCFLPNNH